MKVYELVEKLNKVDQDLDVYLSIDPEGNGFEEIYSVESEYMENGDIVEEDEINCVILWP